VENGKVMFITAISNASIASLVIVAPFADSRAIG
jgi:hypothetical protein